MCLATKCSIMGQNYIHFVKVETCVIAFALFQGLAKIQKANEDSTKEKLTEKEGTGTVENAERIKGDTTFYVILFILWQYH